MVESIATHGSFKLNSFNVFVWHNAVLRLPQIGQNCATYLTWINFFHLA